ncbi:MAG: TonB-dependent receptor [Bacteroidales bacterium]|nr:MAG: TonB-dependent receptor [Bacteroidales bacterium]
MPKVRFKRFTRKSYSAFNSLHKAITIGVLSGCTLLSAHATAVNPVERATLNTSLDSIVKSELDEVTVTATKVDLPIGMATKQIIVIGRTEIEQVSPKSIQDLLNYVAGVDVLQRSPHGVQADISLRGGSFDQTAILLNGVNLTNPQTGHYSFDIPVNISDIERIEIVQGPASLVFGAGAFAGGINIITKKDTKTNIFAKLEGGMHNLFGAETRASYKAKNSTHSISSGYGMSDGYIKNSDYKIFNVLWQSSFDFEKTMALDLQAGYNDKIYGANTFYTPAFPNQYDKTKSIFASVKGKTYGKVQFIPQIYWSRHYDEFQLFREGTPNIPVWYKDHNYHISDVFGANINAQYHSKFGITSVGVELRNERVLSSVLGKPTDTIGKYNKKDSRTNINYFVEHNFIYDRFSLSLAGLLNQHSANRDRLGFYPALNTSFRATKNLSLYASMNMATRMPSFTDMYYRTRTHQGNPDLLPEYSRAVEIGSRYHNSFAEASVAIFYNQGTNLIDWIYNEGDKKWYAVNLPKDKKLSTVGISTGFALNFKNLIATSQPFDMLRLNYQFIDQKNRDASEANPISMYVYNYVKHKFTASLSHDIVRGLSVNWSFRWQDRQGAYTEFVDAKSTGNKVDYTPFSTLDVKVNYEFGLFDIFVKANNIFNKPYVDYGNVPQPGLWVIGGVSVKI